MSVRDWEIEAWAAKLKAAGFMPLRTDYADLSVVHPLSEFDKKSKVKK